MPRRRERTSKDGIAAATRNLTSDHRFQFAHRQQEINDAIAPVYPFDIRGIICARGSFALAAPRGNPIKMFDTDADGTLDLAEVKKAAAALFAKLDPDHDGTLDRRELAGRLSAKRVCGRRSRP